MDRPPGDSRPPIAIVIGTMKSGTTSLFDRLCEHPAVRRPDQKEPGFFSTAYDLGWDWYRQRWHDLAQGEMALDASVSYTLPSHAAEAAARIAHHLPDAPLVVVLRHPLDRMRAHYLHEVQRRREQRPFAEAVAATTSTYVLASDYQRCLHPYVDGPLRPHLLALRTEDLDRPEAWAQLLDHLGLSPMALPPITSNIGAQKQPFSRLGARLWEGGWLQRARALPAPVRRTLRRFAFVGGDEGDLRAGADVGQVPPAIADHVLSSAHRAGEALGLDTAGWR
jgi:hypothetical protein